MSQFKSYRDSIIIRDHLKCGHISAGEYSYYAGYYHGYDFEDCVMYLDELDNKSNCDKLIIGKFCSFASGIRIMMGGTQGHNYNWIASYPLDSFDDNFDGYTNTPPKAHKSKGNTIIENDVWIGIDALIMPGVQIANGAVIAARAVVTKNIGPYEIWGGNPAKFIKKRFSDDEIQKLLKLKWWDWDINKIKEHLHLLRSYNINELLDKIHNE